MKRNAKIQLTKEDIYKFIESERKESDLRDIGNSVIKNQKSTGEWEENETQSKQGNNTLESWMMAENEPKEEIQQLKIINNEDVSEYEEIETFSEEDNTGVEPSLMAENEPKEEIQQLETTNDEEHSEYEIEQQWTENYGIIME